MPCLSRFYEFRPVMGMQLFSSVILTVMVAAPLRAGLSVDDFLKPPLESRPSALWTWLNAHVDHGQLTRELEEMKDKGMRGAIIWDMGSISDPKGMIPHGPAFLGPESLASIHHTMDEARRLGLELGMVASSSWNAGGPWISPEDACKTVAWSTVTVKGPQDYSAILPLPESAMAPSATLAAMAVPADMTTISPDAIIHLDDRLDANRRLTWRVPEGAWKVMFFVSTNTGQQLMCPSPKSKGLMADHLSAEPTRIHFKHVMDRLMTGRKDFGPLKVLMLDSYEVKTPVDWTPEFSKAFHDAYGYKPEPWLPVLAGLTIASDDLSNRFRHDYGRLVSDLVIENHFALARDMVNERGLKLLAEAGHGGHARFDALKALGAADIPMGEFWNHSKNWCVKEAASAANLYGKRLVNAESMTGWQHWQDGPGMYKRLTDIALCAGLNQITFHTFAHNPPEAGLPGYAYHAGEHFNVNLTWWQQARPMLETLSRSCHLLQQGRFVADVCAYYGNGAPNLVPARRISPTAEPRWSEDKCLHCGRPHPVDLSTLGDGHDYDYLNEEILVDRMQVNDGILSLPNGMEYRVLVLPSRHMISPKALAKIEQLVNDGATVVGPKPDRSNSMQGYPQCDQMVQEIANRIWGDCDGQTIRSHRYGKGRVFSNTPLSDVLKQLGIAADFAVEDIDNTGRKIDYIHRTTGSEEIYFVTNTSETRQNFHARFRTGTSRIPSFWNPEDGSVKSCLLYQNDNGTTRIPMELAPFESVFVVFRRDLSGKQMEHATRIEHSPLGTTGTGGNGRRIDVVSINQNHMRLQVGEEGSYRVTTSTGRSAMTTIKSIPADHPINGPWKLTFPPDRGAPASVTLDQLADWTRQDHPGVRYFSGTATYHTQFNAPESMNSHIGNGARVFLNLGSVRETAVVTVNGIRAGILWKSPYRTDITSMLKPGANTLVIDVTNVWNNRLVGDAQRDDDTHITRTNLSFKFKANSPLVPSGLIGPVTLATSVSANIVLPKWEN